MPGSLELAGASPSNKQPVYRPIYHGRFFSGLNTQRSPLRSAGSAYEERYLGVRGDALIDGSNCEITPRLTLARRPGNPVYNSHTFSAIDAFYSFREFGPNSEQIRVMADTSTILYDATGSTQTAVFNKSAGAGQTFMQSVGNTLFFADGIDQKKWVQSLFSRATSGSLPVIANSTTLSAASTPFISTYLIDSNSNLQELLATVQTTVTNVAYVSSTNVLTLSVGSTSGIAKGDLKIIWDAATATWLNGITLSVLTATGVTVTASLVDSTHADYASAGEAAHLTFASGGTPVPGSGVPTWNTTVPASGNLFQGGCTVDGTALWINRGSPIENWGLEGGTTAPTFSVAGNISSWQKSTYYSSPGTVVDANNNVWQVFAKGVSGGSNPFTTNPAVGDTVADGTLTWKCVATHVAAENTWAASTSYTEGKYQGSYPWTANPGDGKFLPDYTSGAFLIANASGTPCLFMLQRNVPANKANVPISMTYGGGTAGHPGWTVQFFNHANADGSSDLDWGGSVGNPVLYGTATPAPPTASATGVSSAMWNFYKDGGSHGYTNSPMHNNTVSPAGIMADGTFTTPWPGQPANSYEWTQYGKIRIPVAGMSVTFFVVHDDSYYFGIDSASGATVTSFTSTTGRSNLFGLGTRVQTPWNGYGILAGNNGSASFGQDAITINFANAGVYGIELVYGNGASGSNSELFFLANNFLITAEQATTTPFFQSGTSMPAFGAAGWNPSLFAPQNTYPSALDSTASAPNPTDWNVPYQGALLNWFNFGPVSTFTWQANSVYSAPTTLIIDTNSNEERAYETGFSGTTQPTWATGLYQTTADQTPLLWINQGPLPTPSTTSGAISAFTDQGYIYYVCLVNTATDTVSNASLASIGTGKFVGGQVKLDAGSGLPPTASIDPQADYVAIFRTTDGESTPFLIPGHGNSIYTISLPEYLANGYLDTTPDTGLNNLIQAPIAGENTPPALGAQNLTFHLSRIWFSVGNTVYWTSNGDSPVGNGVEGVDPLNFQEFPSLVKRIVPTTVGAFIFTVSDVYIITGQGTPTSPIQPAYPYAPGLGLLSYNALDIFGSSIGFYASDKTFNVLDISSGTSEVGFDIGNKLQSNSWNPANAYVTWHSSGEDKAWFLSDGATGWYRISTTPSPEQGVTISPFATIVGGCKAVTSIETSPGTHNLLVGPTSSGPILARSLTNFQDNSESYTWFATVGSIVLANPGQTAIVAFIATDSVATGTPLSLGVIFDEAVPYYTGAFLSCPQFVNDPPNLDTTSLFAQRFYTSLTQKPEECRHLQMQFTFPAENVQNEILTMTIFGKLHTEN